MLRWSTVRKGEPTIIWRSTRAGDKNRVNSPPLRASRSVARGEPAMGEPSVTTRATSAVHRWAAANAAHTPPMLWPTRMARRPPALRTAWCTWQVMLMLSFWRVASRGVDMRCTRVAPVCGSVDVT